MAIRRFVDRVLEHPAVYAAWQAPFVAQKFAPVERCLSRTTVRRVLDVGCGPGTNARRFAGAEYVGVDINEPYLVIARAKYQADLSALGTFDTILVNSFLHHLPDDAVGRILRQLHHRLDPGGTVHFLELVMPERRSRATVMAKLDRGRYARPLGSWCALFKAHFEPVVIEPYEYGCGLWAMIHFQGKAR